MLGWILHASGFTIAFGLYGSSYIVSNFGLVGKITLPKSETESGATTPDVSLLLNPHELHFPAPLSETQSFLYLAGFASGDSPTFMSRESSLSNETFQLGIPSFVPLDALDFDTKCQVC